MLTKQQLKENIKKKYGSYLSSHGVNEESLTNFIQEQMMLYCKPECMTCFDKGFSSSFHGYSTAGDFVGEKDTNDPLRPRLLFCICSRGQDLKKLIELNYKELI